MRDPPVHKRLNCQRISYKTQFGALFLAIWKVNMRGECAMNAWCGVELLPIATK
jgi:hypothetical protein